MAVRQGHQSSSQWKVSESDMCHFQAWAIKTHTSSTLYVSFCQLCAMTRPEGLVEPWEGPGSLNDPMEESRFSSLNTTQDCYL